MKKILTTCWFACLACSPSIVRAFEAPSLLENNLADYVLRHTESYFNLSKREGIFNFICSGNLRTNIAGGFQGAVPIFSSKYVLARFETNLLATKSISSNKESLPLGKFGLSFRKILQPNFIMGGYFFYDLTHTHSAQSSDLQMGNLGVELMWPRYGMVVIDSVFDPTNAMDDSTYQCSIKFSSLKPQVLEIFGGLSITKYPNYSHKLTITLPGIKRPIPIKKWNTNKWITLGLACTYTKKADSFFNPKNFGVSGYLQVNVIYKPKNSLRDYLRMPVDRFFAIPYHPSNR